MNFPGEGLEVKSIKPSSTGLSRFEITIFLLLTSFGVSEYLWPPSSAHLAP